MAETSDADSFKVVSIRKAEAENNNGDKDNDEEEGDDYEDDHEDNGEYVSCHFIHSNSFRSLYRCMCWYTSNLVAISIYNSLLIHLNHCFATAYNL